MSVEQKEPEPTFAGVPISELPVPLLMAFLRGAPATSVSKPPTTLDEFMKMDPVELARLSRR